MRASALPVLLSALGVVLAAAGATPGPVLIDGPPAGHTGASGEPTCQVCHFGAPLDAPGGRLLLQGVPDAYAPGRAYTLTLVLESELMGAAGFQIGARRPDGTQGGAFRALDPRVAVRDSAGLSWAQHTRAGTVVSNPDVASWSVTWIAPESGAVLFGAAANSGNGDDSPFSDLVYTTTARSRPAPPQLR